MVKLKGLFEEVELEAEKRIGTEARILMMSIEELWSASVGFARLLWG